MCLKTSNCNCSLMDVNTICKKKHPSWKYHNPFYFTRGLLFIIGNYLPAAVCIVDNSEKLS